VERGRHPAHDERDQPRDEGHQRAGPHGDDEEQDGGRNGDEVPEEDGGTVQRLRVRDRDPHRVTGIVVKRERRVGVGKHERVPPDPRRPAQESAQEGHGELRQLPGEQRGPPADEGEDRRDDTQDADRDRLRYDQQETERDAESWLWHGIRDRDQDGRR
jgi:hypothetical protein